jgi:hypothetical protein
MKEVKTNKINVIKNKLTNEYPYINVIVIKSNNKTYLELCYNPTKNIQNINKFNSLDGGIKDRIVRKTKNLLKQYKLDYLPHSIHKYIFAIR